MAHIFPEGSNTENRLIYLSGSGNSGKTFSVLISNQIIDLNCQHSGGQGFPLYLYEETEDDTIDFGGSVDMFAKKSEAKSRNGYTRKDGISDDGLAHF